MLWPAIIKRNNKPKIDNGLKNRLIKNREMMLDVMAENIKGARACPLLSGAKCIGMMCEHMMEFKNIDKDGKEQVFSRCAHVQISLLLIEVCQELRKINKEKKE